MHCLFGLAVLWGFVLFAYLFTLLLSGLRLRPGFSPDGLCVTWVAVLLEKSLVPWPCGGNHSAAGAALQGAFLFLVGSHVLFGLLSPASPKALAGIGLAAEANKEKQQLTLLGAHYVPSTTPLCIVAHLIPTLPSMGGALTIMPIL